MGKECCRVDPRGGCLSVKEERYNSSITVHFTSRKIYINSNLYSVQGFFTRRELFERERKKCSVKIRPVCVIF